MTEERIILHSVGSLPGIPGTHGPGEYLVDYEARTIRVAPKPSASTPPPDDPAPALRRAAK